MASGIGRASALLASGTIVSRILGFVKIWLFAQIIGAQIGGDAFNLANQLPNTVYAIVAGGVLTAVLVPQIVRSALHADGGSAYINKLVTIAFVVLGGTTLIATFLAPQLTLLAAGPTVSQAQLDLAIALAYWCMPQIFFYGLYTVLGEVLNARGSFGPFTWVPVLNNVVAMGGLVVFAILFGSDPGGTLSAQAYSPAMVAVLGASTTLGVVVQAVVLFYFWRRIGLSYRPDFRWRGVGLGAAGRMAGWTFGMLLLTTIAGFIETRVAMGASGDDNASVTMMSWAWLIFMLPHSIITVSIATAYFTRMSEHASRGLIPLVRTDASSAIRGTTLIIMLASAVLLVCAYPFAAVFVSESFAQVQSLGNVIIAYVLGLVAFCVLFVLQRTFYALGDTKTPFYFTLFQSVLVVGGTIGCAFLPRPWIAVGIALVVTIAGIAQAALAAFLLRRKIGGIDGARIVRSLVRYFVAAIPAAIVGVLLLLALGGTSAGGFALAGTFSAIVSMTLIGLAMSAAYFGMLLLMRVPELSVVLDPVLARIRRR